MPSPTAGLFGGLAQGIFGRMQEHEDEQRKLDLDERKSALTSLSSLLEHATPETRPAIYKQMSEVMKLKGKHRGVWDMLTGGGRDDYHNQLSSQLDNVFGNVMGPQAYEAATIAAPTSGDQADWGDESAGLSYTPPAGKIALRDPIAEHLTALKSQYGLQNDRRSQEIELRNRLTGEREAANDERDATNKLKDREVAAQIAAEKKVRAIATAFALKRQSKIPSDEEFAAAAEQVAATDGLNVDKLKAQIGFLESGSRRNDAQAQNAGSIDKPITPYQAVQIDKDQQAKSGAVYEKWSKAKGEMDRIGREQQSLRAQLNNINPTSGFADPTGKFVFDESAGRFIDKATGQPAKFVSPIVQKQIAKIAELEALKAAHKQEMSGNRSVLESQFPSLYTFGDEWSVTPNPQTGGVAPAGAPRTGPPPEWKVPTEPVTGVTQYKSTSPLPKGTIIETGRGKFRIIGVKGKDKDGTIIHNIEPVKE
jgi:hypothetical protein